ncbi:unnamed protein product [Diamesa hyperborea]
MDYQNYKAMCDSSLQKIQKSEFERQELNDKLQKMYQEKSDCEKSIIKTLQSQQKQFMEEKRRRAERNENILRTLDRIDYQASVLAAKTDRLRALKKQYEKYLISIWNTRRSPPYPITRSPKAISPYSSQYAGSAPSVSQQSYFDPREVQARVVKNLFDVHVAPQPSSFNYQHNPSYYSEMPSSITKNPIKINNYDTMSNITTGPVTTDPENYHFSLPFQARYRFDDSQKLQQPPPPIEKKYPYHYEDLKNTNNNSNNIPDDERNKINPMRKTHHNDTHHSTIDQKNCYEKLNSPFPNKQFEIFNSNPKSTISYHNDSTSTSVTNLKQPYATALDSTIEANTNANANAENRRENITNDSLKNENLHQVWEKVVNAEPVVSHSSFVIPKIIVEPTVKNEIQKRIEQDTPEQVLNQIFDGTTSHSSDNQNDSLSFQQPPQHISNNFPLKKETESSSIYHYDKMNEHLNEQQLQEPPKPNAIEHELRMKNDLHQSEFKTSDWNESQESIKPNYDYENYNQENQPNAQPYYDPDQIGLTDEYLDEQPQEINFQQQEQYSTDNPYPNKSSDNQQPDYVEENIDENKLPNSEFSTVNTTEQDENNYNNYNPQLDSNQHYQTEQQPSNNDYANDPSANYDYDQTPQIIYDDQQQQQQEQQQQYNEYTASNDTLKSTTNYEVETVHDGSMIRDDDGDGETTDIDETTITTSTSTSESIEKQKKSLDIENENENETKSNANEPIDNVAVVDESGLNALYETQQDDVKMVKQLLDSESDDNSVKSNLKQQANDEKENVDESDFDFSTS